MYLRWIDESVGIKWHAVSSSLFSPDIEGWANKILIPLRLASLNWEKNSERLTLWLKTNGVAASIMVSKLLPPCEKEVKA